MRHQDFRYSRRREFDAVPITHNLVFLAPDPGSAKPAPKYLPVHRSAGSSNGSALRRRLGSSNSPMDLAMLSFMELCWPKVGSLPSSQEKPSKCVSAPATRDHMSQKY